MVIPTQILEETVSSTKPFDVLAANKNAMDMTESADNSISVHIKSTNEPTLEIAQLKNEQNPSESHSENKYPKPITSRTKPRANEKTKVEVEEAVACSEPITVITPSVSQHTLEPGVPRGKEPTFSQKSVEDGVQSDIPATVELPIAIAPILEFGLSRNIDIEKPDVATRKNPEVSIAIHTSHVDSYQPSAEHFNSQMELSSASKSTLIDSSEPRHIISQEQTELERDAATNTTQVLEQDSRSSTLDSDLNEEAIKNETQDTTQVPNSELPSTSVTYIIQDNQTCNLVKQNSAAKVNDTQSLDPETPLYVSEAQPSSLLPSAELTAPIEPQDTVDITEPSPTGALSSNNKRMAKDKGKTPIIKETNRLMEQDLGYDTLSTDLKRGIQSLNRPLEIDWQSVPASNSVDPMPKTASSVLVEAPSGVSLKQGIDSKDNQDKIETCVVPSLEGAESPESGSQSSKTSPMPSHTDPVVNKLTSDNYSDAQDVVTQARPEFKEIFHGPQPQSEDNLPSIDTDQLQDHLILGHGLESPFGKKHSEEPQGLALNSESLGPRVEELTPGIIDKTSHLKKLSKVEKKKLKKERKRQKRLTAEIIAEPSRSPVLAFSSTENLESFAKVVSPVSTAVKNPSHGRQVNEAPTPLENLPSQHYSSTTEGVLVEELELATTILDVHENIRKPNPKDDILAHEPCFDQTSTENAPEIMPKSHLENQQRTLNQDSEIMQHQKSKVAATPVENIIASEYHITGTKHDLESNVIKFGDGVCPISELELRKQCDSVQDEQAVDAKKSMQSISGYDSGKIKVVQSDSNLASGHLENESHTSSPNLAQGSDVLVISPNRDAGTSENLTTICTSPAPVFSRLSLGNTKLSKSVPKKERRKSNEDKAHLITKSDCNSVDLPTKELDFSEESLILIKEALEGADQQSKPINVGENSLLDDTGVLLSELKPTPEVDVSLSLDNVYSIREDRLNEDQRAHCDDRSQNVMGDAQESTSVCKQIFKRAILGQNKSQGDMVHRSMNMSAHHDISRSPAMAENKKGEKMIKMASKAISNEGEPCSLKNDKNSSASATYVSQEKEIELQIVEKIRKEHIHEHSAEVRAMDDQVTSETVAEFQHSETTKKIGSVDKEIEATKEIEDNEVSLSLDSTMEEKFFVERETRVPKGERDGNNKSCISNNEVEAEYGTKSINRMQKWDDTNVEDQEHTTAVFDQMGETKISATETVAAVSELSQNPIDIQIGTLPPISTVQEQPNQPGENAARSHVEELSATCDDTIQIDIMKDEAQPVGVNNNDDILSICTSSEHNDTGKVLQTQLQSEIHTAKPSSSVGHKDHGIVSVDTSLTNSSIVDNVPVPSLSEKKASNSSRKEIIRKDVSADTNYSRLSSVASNLARTDHSSYPEIAPESENAFTSSELFLKNEGEPSSLYAQRSNIQSTNKSGVAISRNFDDASSRHTSQHATSTSSNTYTSTDHNNQEYIQSSQSESTTPPLTIKQGKRTRSLDTAGSTSKSQSPASICIGEASKPVVTVLQSGKSRKPSLSGDKHGIADPELHYESVLQRKPSIPYAPERQREETKSPIFGHGDSIEQPIILPEAATILHSKRKGVSPSNKLDSTAHRDKRQEVNLSPQLPVSGLDSRALDDYSLRKSPRILSPVREEQESRQKRQRHTLQNSKRDGDSNIAETSVQYGQHDLKIKTQIKNFDVHSDEIHAMPRLQHAHGQVKTSLSDMDGDSTETSLGETHIPGRNSSTAAKSSLTLFNCSQQKSFPESITPRSSLSPKPLENQSPLSLKPIEPTQNLYTMPIPRVEARQSSPPGSRVEANRSRRRLQPPIPDFPVATSASVPASSRLSAGPSAVERLDAREKNLTRQSADTLEGNGTTRAISQPALRSISDDISRTTLPSSSPSAVANRRLSNTGITRLKTPEPQLRSDSPNIVRHGTPTLRNRQISCDLRSLSHHKSFSGSQLDLSRSAATAVGVPATEAAVTCGVLAAHSGRSTPSRSFINTPIANEGRVRSKDMSESVYVSKFFSHFFLSRFICFFVP